MCQTQCYRPLHLRGHRDSVCSLIDKALKGRTAKAHAVQLAGFELNLPDAKACVTKTEKLKRRNCCFPITFCLSTTSRGAQNWGHNTTLISTWKHIHSPDELARHWHTNFPLPKAKSFAQLALGPLLFQKPRAHTLTLLLLYIAKLTSSFSIWSRCELSKGSFLLLQRS